MPAEWCRVCDHENREVGVANRQRLIGEQVAPSHRRRGEHHGTGCRYSLCNDHCSCTREAQMQWRTLVRGGNTRFSCAACGNNTSHVCVQHVRENMSRHRYCGLCCNEGACVDRYACSGRPVEPTFVCDYCHLVRAESLLLTQEVRVAFGLTQSQDRPGCMSCFITSCAHCNMIPTTSGGVCRRCERCSIPPEAFDEDGEPVDGVDYGQWHCRCTNGMTRPTLLYVEVPSFANVQNAKATKRGPAMRAMGVELEVCGFVKPKRKALEELYNTCAKWGTAIGTDGSLPRDGVEIRTSPASGNLFYRQLGEVMRAINKANGFVNQQAGLHVHVDVRDARTALSQQYDAEAKALGFHNGLDVVCYIYRFVEPVFYGMADETRQNNTYASSWAALELTDKWIENNTRVASHQGWFYVIRNILQRRAGLNLIAYEAHRTLEFRLHHGCLNRRMVTAYAMICSEFVDKCMRAKDPRKLIVYIAKHGPMAFMQKIAPTEDAKHYLTWRADKANRKAA